MTPKFILIGAISAAFIIFASLYIYFIGWPQFTCNARAKAQDLKAGNYSLIAGCIFTLKDGKKVNEKNYRVI